MQWSCFTSPYRLPSLGMTYLEAFSPVLASSHVMSVHPFPIWSKCFPSYLPAALGFSYWQRWFKIGHQVWWSVLFLIQFSRPAVLLGMLTAPDYKLTHELIQLLYIFILQRQTGQTWQFFWRKYDLVESTWRFESDRPGFHASLSNFMFSRLVLWPLYATFKKIK